MVRLLTKNPKITVFKSFKLRAQSSLSIEDLSRPQSLRYFCPADGATDVSHPRRCTKGSRPLGTRLIEDWCREDNKQTNKINQKEGKTLSARSIEAIFSAINQHSNFQHFAPIADGT